jgi:UDP-glucose 4-epimerase
LSTAREEYRGESSEDPGEQDLIKAVRSLWAGDEKLLLSRNHDGRPYKQHYSDVRDIVQGLVLGIEKRAAAGEVFNLAGAALFDWGEAVPYLAERYGLDTVEARVPYPNYFELDLTKIRTLLGYRPEHDLASILDTAEAMRRGEDTEVIPTGVRFGGV